jgi:hypothetical protein
MPVRYQLPPNMHAVTVGTFNFEGDENGVITVGDDVPASVVNTLEDPHHMNLVRAPDVEEAAAQTDAGADTTDTAAQKKPAAKKG